ncbi:MAG: hypothetical protein H0W62_03065 [Chitinophagales bacterium]|nr:hypothetical protein [Chitinophagales bacterium]
MKIKHMVTQFKHSIPETVFTCMMVLITYSIYGQVNISISTDKFYVVDDLLLGAGPPLYPEFLSPPPPCSKCEKANSGNPCANLDTLLCPGTVSCVGQWRTGLPPNLKEDIAALKFRCMYYPDGTTFRYYHYVPGGKGYCIKSNEADVLNAWSYNNGNDDPDPGRRYCGETAYNYANIFEQNTQLCRNDQDPAKSMHLVISADVFFGSYADLRRMFDYCAANGIIVDAIVFGTEIEHSQNKTPSYITPTGDTLPFPSGQSYFNAVKHYFLDSLKANPVYSTIPLFFSTAIQHGAQGDCEDRTYECDDSLGNKSRWNVQVHNAISAYNKTHYPHLRFSGAVNWWWFPISNSASVPSPSIAINDMNNFFETGLSATGHPKCYKYPVGNIGDATTGFDELLLNQWGIKKFKMICESHDYANTFLNQVFILKRVFNMFDNNYNMRYNPSLANGITYKGAFFYRLGSNNEYNPLDLTPDSLWWNTVSTANYAFRQINDVSGHKFKRATISGVSQNFEAYFLFNCMEQKLFIINYSGIPYSIESLTLDSSSYADTSHFDYLETSVADTATGGVLATLSQMNENVSHSQVKLTNISVPPNSILIIDIPYNHQPGSAEICNGIDDDCDSQIDEDVQSMFYLDSDSDDYGNINGGMQLTGCTPPLGYSSNNSDCNDNNGSINPGTAELCNGIDDNCNGSVDEGVKTSYYADADHDNYGNPSAITQSCTAPNGYIINNTDCNDANASIHPNAQETCNGLDDNCDGSVDEGVKITYYADTDRDSYGNLLASIQACTLPNGYVSNSTDCNDENASVNPGAIETCNNIDDNCNGSVDEGVKTNFYADADNDGYGNLNVVSQACSPPAGYTSNSTDCNDGNAAINPGAIDICNSIDDNCNQVVDENAIQASINPGGTVNICSGTSLILTANSGSGISYQWLKNSKNISGATSQTYSAKTAAGYQVKETNTFSCNATSLTTTLNITTTPTATITPLGNLNICQSGSVTLQANSGTGFTYQWQKGSNNITGATNQNYTATKAATYKVIVTYNGCSKTSAGTKVTQTCKENFTGNNEPDHFNLFPNPTHGSFTIDLIFTGKENEPGMLEIFNEIGETIHKEKIMADEDVGTNGVFTIRKEFSFNPGLPPGIYMVKIILNAGVYSAQLIYQK